jgi:hypothetical protein
MMLLLKERLRWMRAWATPAHADRDHIRWRGEIKADKHACKLPGASNRRGYGFCRVPSSLRTFTVP